MPSGALPGCRVPELSPSTDLAPREAAQAARRLRDEQLVSMIEETHAESGPCSRPPLARIAGDPHVSARSVRRSGQARADGAFGHAARVRSFRRQSLSLMASASG